MKKKYVIDDVNRNIRENNAGYKARDDVNQILSDTYKVAYFLTGNTKLNRLWNYIKLAFDVSMNAETVVVQYPFYVSKMYRSLLKLWLPKESILLIHDIDSLRNQLDKSHIDKEIKVFNQFKYIISHNIKMTNWLKENNCRSHIIELEIFDYLTDTKEKNINRENSIAFAGNLSFEKSKFLYTLSDIQYSLNVYGSNFNESNVSYLNYKGTFPAEKLPSILNEKFGLIWDGTSANECAGIYGNYLRYNNPHKASLYLVSELPVIIWEEAAIASFIKKNKIGFVIKSLEEINKIMAEITDSEYKEMIVNTKDISKKMKQGYYLKSAIDKCLEKKNEKL